MTDKMRKPPAVRAAEGQPIPVGANGKFLFAQNAFAGKVSCAGFRDCSGRLWRYRGKHGRVLAMLATMEEGVTQSDCLPWHTRLGETIHTMRFDGLDISTEREGEFRRARYRLETPGRLVGVGIFPERAA